MKGRKTGGRRKGTLSKTTLEVREFAQKLLSYREYQTRLKARLLAGDLAPHLEGLLWALCLGQAEGQARPERGQREQGHHGDLGLRRATRTVADHLSRSASSAPQDSDRHGPTRRTDARTPSG